MKGSTKATNKTRGSSRAGAARRSFYIDSSDEDDDDIEGLIDDSDDESVKVTAKSKKTPAKKSEKIAKPKGAKKVIKTNDAGDVKEEAKK